MSLVLLPKGNAAITRRKESEFEESLMTWKSGGKSLGGVQNEGPVAGLTQAFSTDGLPRAERNGSMGAEVKVSW